MHELRHERVRVADACFSGDEACPLLASGSAKNCLRCVYRSMHIYCAQNDPNIKHRVGTEVVTGVASSFLSLFLLKYIHCANARASSNLVPPNSFFWHFSPESLSCNATLAPLALKAFMRVGTEVVTGVASSFSLLVSLEIYPLC
jgi:hypothetical protein